MRKKLNYDEIKKRFENKGLILLENKIKNEHQKLKCCDYEGYYYCINYNNISCGKKPKRFIKTNPYTIINIQHYLDLNYNGTKILSEKFINKKEKLKFICGCCNNEFLRNWEDIYINKRFICRNCLKEKNSKKYSYDFVNEKLKENGFILLDKEYKGNNYNLNCIDNEGYKVNIKFSNIINNINKKPYRFSHIFNSNNYIYNINNYFKLNDINCNALFYLCDNKYKNYPTIYCKCECGNVFYTNFGAIKNGQFRCQQCTNYISVIENKVKNWLDKKNFEYIQQKNFDDCINDKTNNPLYFDFYLPKCNCCIEVDGKQHYEPVKFHNETDLEAENELKDRIYRDNIKNNYCIKNNIKLIRIKQNEIEKNHEEYKIILYNLLIKKVTNS